MRTAPGEVRHFFHALDDFVADRRAEFIRLIVDFMPAEFHHADEKDLDEAMAADIHDGFALPLRRQGDAAIGFVLQIARFLEALHHARDGWC